MMVDLDFQIYRQIQSLYILYMQSLDLDLLRETSLDLSITLDLLESRSTVDLDLDYML